METKGHKDYIDVDGLLLPSWLDVSTVRKNLECRSKAGEIVVTSYPKCGTMWTLQMCFMLLRGGEPFTTARDYFNLICDLTTCPEENRRPKICYSHFPFDRLTYSPEAKYIYVTRHPADCFVSRYHFNLYLPMHDFPTGCCFDQYFDRFLEGRLAYGDFFDHLVSWYRQKDQPNVLFLNYEAMKDDTRETVIKIAQFLDYKVEDLLADDEAKLNKILHLCSLDSMRGSVNRFFDEYATTPPGTDEHGDRAAESHKMLYSRNQFATALNGFNVSGRFVREGRVGDGKRALSHEQKERLRAKMEEKIGDLDVMDLWKNW